MKEPLKKIVSKETEHLKQKVAKLNETVKASKDRNQRLLEGKMHLGKKELKTIAGLVFLTSFIFIEGISLLSSDFLSSAPTSKGDSISSLLQEQQTMTAIDMQRRSSVHKITGIISRYNRTMPDTDKMRIANEIYEMTKKYPNLNEDFICATITHETGKTWNPQIKSPMGAMGLMQIMPATGAFLAAQEGIDWISADQVLYDPVSNIRLGCRYMSELVGTYQHDGALAAYNGGPKRAALWLASNRNDSTLFKETRTYVPAVNKLYDQFRGEGVM
ncbi:MAG TPA: transglycosylase SLT domain-containing protein [bacterium]|nr:transglycosylase SLT domain-containing protein [bacterium]HPR87615.1 transglycosylase SLT domain-containing protein [bacterium]